MSPSALDLYELFLKAEDLGGKSHTLEIIKAWERETYIPRKGENEGKIAMRFKGAKKTLLLNKTQVTDMIKITGTDDYTKWVKWFVVLSPAQAANKKDTIKITAAPQPAPMTAPPQRESAEIIKELYA